MFHSRCIHIRLRTKRVVVKTNVYFVLWWCVKANPFLQIYFYHNFVQLSTPNSPTQAHNYRYGTLVLYCIKKKCFCKLFSTRIKYFFVGVLASISLLNKCVVSWSKKNDDWKNVMVEKYYVPNCFFAEQILPKQNH